MIKASSVFNRFFSPLIESFRMLRGNEKVNVLVLPLYSIPNNLTVSYASLYMLALGLTTTQIGTLSAITSASQFFLLLFSFYFTDKFGRKRISRVGDIFGLIIPYALLAMAKNETWFFIYAILSGFTHFNAVAFSCINSEGYSDEERYAYYTWDRVFGLFGYFFMPIGGYIVGCFGLVNAMRGLYWFACIGMSVLEILRIFFLQDSDIAKQRMLEMKGVGYLQSMSSYWPAVKTMLSQPIIWLAVLIQLCSSVSVTLENVYLSIWATEKLLFPEASISIFMLVHALVMFFTLVLISPKIKKRIPALLTGFFLEAAGMGGLLFCPPGSYEILFTAVSLFAAGSGIITPTISTIVARHLDDRYRSINVTVTLVLSTLTMAPVSYINGYLAELSRSIPFIFIVICCVVGAVLTVYYGRRISKNESA